MTPLELIADMLKRTMGLDARSIGQAAIAQAVAQRLGAQQTPTQHTYLDSAAVLADLDALTAYHAHLCNSSTELQHLIEAVVVPETWFCRDRDALNTLLNLTREQLQRVPARPVRILCLPCATGEEAYSIAMVLRDGGIAAHRVQIDAVDISGPAIATACLGMYGKNSFRAELGALRERYFDVAGPGLYRVVESIRTAVHFQRGNLFEPLPLLRAAAYDFIFCRNMLIYFDRADQDRAVTLLLQALAPHGTLFVGPAETALLGRHPLSSIQVAFAFGFNKVHDHAAPANAHDTQRARPPAHGLAVRQPHGAAKAPAAAPRHAAPLGAQRGSNHVLDSAWSGLASSTTPAAAPHAYAPAPIGAPSTTAAAGARGAAALAVADKAPRPEAGALLERAFASANQGRLAEAARAAEQYLAQYGTHADAFYLLGLVSDAGHDPAAAREYYRKALYLDPTHRETLAHLAVLLELAGDHGGARTMRARAARLERAGGAPAASSRGTS